MIDYGDMSHFVKILDDNSLRFFKDLVNREYYERNIDFHTQRQKELLESDPIQPYLEDLLRQGKKIQTIKEVRRLLRCGLKEAKELTESLSYYHVLHSDSFHAGLSSGD